MISLAGAVLVRLITWKPEDENMSDLDELRDLVNDFCNDLGRAEPEPEKLASWIGYLLEGLDNKASGRRDEFWTMLKALGNALETRITGGRW